MITLAIIDSGAGGLTVLKKLYGSLPADYIYYADIQNAPYSDKSPSNLHTIANKLIQNICRQQKTDGILLANTSFTSNFCQTLTCVNVPVFCCEPPIQHACQYTASYVLAVGEQNVLDILVKKKLSNVIYRELPNLSQLIHNGNKIRETSTYIEQCTADILGQFDCIVLCSTDYALCKDSFQSVFPAAKIFDSADGAVQRIKRHFGRQQRGESRLQFVFSQEANKNNEKYLKFAQEILKFY